MAIIPISRIVAFWAGQQPDRVAIDHEGAQVTWAELDARTNRLARAYEALGVKPDDFVTIAEGLLEYETLSGDEIKALIRGDKPARDLGDDTPQSRGSSVPKTGTPKGGQAEAEGGFEPQPQ